MDVLHLAALLGPVAVALLGSLAWVVLRAPRPPRPPAVPTVIEAAHDEHVRRIETAREEHAARVGETEARAELPPEERRAANVASWQGRRR